MRGHRPSLIKKAYKKLKSSVFYDKTQLILRDKIVEFESTSDELGFCIGAKLRDLFEDINNLRPLGTAKIGDSRICKVSFFSKKLKSIEPGIITNTVSKTPIIDEVQYFIDMDVRGHILGVLWILLIGRSLDKGVYEHSYGNRIRKKLINEVYKNVTYSPKLFEPYFILYENWREIPRPFHMHERVWPKVRML